MIGASYRETEFANKIGLDELTPLLEYGGEIVTDDQAGGATYILNSSEARPFRDALLGRLRIQFNADWSASIGGSYNFRDKDTNIASRLTYGYSDNLEFQLDSQLFNGKSDTAFGRWRENDYVRLGAIWHF